MCWFYKHDILKHRSKSLYLNGITILFQHSRFFLVSHLFRPPPTSSANKLKLPCVVLWSTLDVSLSWYSCMARTKLPTWLLCSRMGKPSTSVLIPSLDVLLIRHVINMSFSSDEMFSTEAQIVSVPRPVCESRIVSSSIVVISTVALAGGCRRSLR
jgi:hypothetical protein